MNQPTAAPHSGPIPVMLTTLQSHLHKLEATVHDLGERVRPVSLPINSVDAKERPTEAKELMSPVQDYLVQLCKTVEMLTVEVAGMTDRLEI